jgi:GDP-fucose protein O-fucosyltransferase
MVQKGVSDMMSGISRIKWYKYRYALLAALLVNVLLINYFFLDTSVSNLTAFGEAPIDHTTDVSEPKAAPLPSSGASTPQHSPAKAGKTSKPSETIAAKPAAPLIPRPPSASTFNLGDYDFNGEYIGWPLERVCNETKFQSGLVFVCDNNSGGIGNIRNFILTCIRYAIDSGATGIIMPRIQRRSEEDLANIFTTTLQPFDYFFDEQHFLYALGTHCPQLAIYNTTEDIPNSQNKTEIKEFYPKDLNHLDAGDPRGRNRYLDMYRTKFDTWLRETKRTPAEAKPVTIRFKWPTFFEWPTYRDGPEFANTFGDILRIRKDIADLAAATLTEMSKFASVDPLGGGVLSLQAPYLGVHLRSESDALEFWPNFDTQSNGYLKEAEKRQLKHAYLACGNASDSHRFAEKAWNKLQLNVTSKLDLLKEDDLKKLQDLSWDQQALVDFLVLTKSTHFTGCSFSSFTMNIAIKRHLMTGGINTRQWRSPGDVYSTLVGRFESWWPDWMFMVRLFCS